MRCPFCTFEDTKVIDSRLVAEGGQVRRRRECLSCAERFTTYESAELLMPKVIKSNDRREPFDEEKLRAGILRALEKRAVSVEKIEATRTRLRLHLPWSVLAPMQPLPGYRFGLYLYLFDNDGTGLKSAMAWPWPRWVLVTKSPCFSAPHTPVATASSPM